MEIPKPIKLRVPPEGKAEAHITGLTSMIRWAPGNGLVYQLLVTPISDEMAEWIGGRILLSVMRRDGQTYTTYPGNPGGLYHISYVEEKWGRDLSEEEIHYVTALLNWALFDDEVATKYAQENFEEARKRWV